MRLLDLDVLAGLLLPVLGEGRVEILIELAGRIVGNVQDRRVGLSSAGKAGEAEGEAERQGAAAGKVKGFMGGAPLGVVLTERRLRFVPLGNEQKRNAELIQRADRPFH